nr:unnamed protein product [Spirometra erinaceieuropaei]
MPQRKGLLAPQNTFLDTIATRFDGTHSNFVLGNAQVKEFPIVYCSDGFVELTGFNRSQIMSRSCNCSFIWGAKTAESAKDKIWSALNGHTELKIEVTFHKKSGLGFFCLLDIVPIKNEKGQVVLFLVSHKDLTQEKRNQGAGALSCGLASTVTTAALVAKSRSGAMMSTLNNNTLPGRVGSSSEPPLPEKPRINLQPSARRASSPYPTPAKARNLTRKRFCSFRHAANNSISHFRRGSPSSTTQNADSTAETPVASEENNFSTFFGDGNSRSPNGAGPMNMASSAVSTAVDVEVGKNSDNWPKTSLPSANQFAETGRASTSSSGTSDSESTTVYKYQRRRSRAVLYHLSGRFDKSNKQKMHFKRLPQLSTKNSMPEYKVQDIKASKCIILHYSIFKIVWDWLIVLCTFYFAVVVPFNAAFQRDNHERTLRNLDMVLEVLFIVDILLNFRTTFVSKSGQVVHQSKAIAINYIRGWFILDLIAAVPFDVVWTIQSPESPVANWMHLMKLARLLRLARLFQKIERYSQYSAVVLGLLMCMFFLLAHWFACGWYKLGRTEVMNVAIRNHSWLYELSERTQTHFTANMTGGPSPSSVYVSSLYFMMSSLTSVGFGNVSPNTTNEKIFSIIAMLVGALMHAAVFGNVTTIIQRVYARRSAYQMKNQDLKDFTRAHHLPKQLRQRMLEFYQAMWSINRGIDKQSIMQIFPEEMRGDIALHINREILSLPIFKSASIGCQMSIAQLIGTRFSTPGEFLVHRGDAIRYLHFVCSGSLEILDEDGSVVALLGKGDLFGTDIDDRPLIGLSAFDVKALTYCELQFIVLDHTLFDVLNLYPAYLVEFASALHDELSFNIKEGFDPLSREGVTTFAAITKTVSPEPDAAVEAGLCHSNDIRTPSPVTISTISMPNRCHSTPCGPTNISMHGKLERLLSYDSCLERTTTGQSVSNRRKSLLNSPNKVQWSISEATSQQESEDEGEMARQSMTKDSEAKVARPGENALETEKQRAKGQVVEVVSGEQTSQKGKKALFAGGKNQMSFDSRFSRTGTSPREKTAPHTFKSSFCPFEVLQERGSDEAESLPKCTNQRNVDEAAVVPSINNDDSKEAINAELKDILLLIARDIHSLRSEVRSLSNEISDLKRGLVTTPTLVGSAQSERQRTPKSQSVHSGIIKASTIGCFGEEYQCTQFSTRTFSDDTAVLAHSTAGKLRSTPPPRQSECFCSTKCICMREFRKAEVQPSCTRKASGDCRSFIFT